MSKWKLVDGRGWEGADELELFRKGRKDATDNKKGEALGWEWRSSLKKNEWVDGSDLMGGERGGEGRRNKRNWVEIDEGGVEQQNGVASAGIDEKIQRNG